MATRVGINGFGRIGRQSLKAIIERAPEVEVVAVNDLVDTRAERPPLQARLDLRHLSGHRRATPTTRSSSTAREIKVLKEKDPAALPWGDLGVDIVLESTGIFTDAEKARRHIAAGAKKVIISAPAKGEDITIVLGVNEGNVRPGPSTTSSATPAARRTAWRRPPRSSTTRSASSTGS